MNFEGESIQILHEDSNYTRYKNTTAAAFRTKAVSSGGNNILTRLSSIRMRASNSCSPICHLGGELLPSPDGDPGERDLALYLPGSRRTKLSGPPALARVRTFSKTSR